ncbi:MAG TPA: hypothetical protein VEC37_15015 [Bacillota bacterium]|nr:hypothetical protein [Bacillota bacterium]
MKKSLLTLVTSLLLLSAGSAAWGNEYTIKAENGRILTPAGFGLEVSGNPTDTTRFNARASYGIAKMVTVGADWFYAKDGEQQLFLNASINPSRQGSGYTGYVQYYPEGEEFTQYGVTFWQEFGSLYTFVNLDSQKELSAQERDIRLTPGVSLRITPRVRLAGELAVDPTDWHDQELRLGVGYKLADRLTAKINGSQKLKGEKDRTFTASVALEI